MNPNMRAAVERIVRLVAEHCEITPEAILGKDRHRTVAEARLLCYWLAKRTTRLSFPEIGDSLGKDHTSVMSGVKSCARRFEKDDWFRRSAIQLHALLTENAESYELPDVPLFTPATLQ